MDLAPVPVPVAVVFRRREAVTVEGGRFEDSIVVDSSARFVIQDLSDPVLEFELAQREWYARGVGLVKLVYGNSGTTNGPSDWELTDHGTLSSPPPKLLSVSPASGALAGETEVILSGEAFAPGAKVMFGGFPAKSVTVESPTVIRAVTPVLSAGPAEVTVANADCQVSILDAGFTFE